MQTLRLAGQFVLDGFALRAAAAVALRIGDDEHLEGLLERSLALHQGLLRAHQASHAEASTQEGLAVIQQLPGNLYQGVVDVRKVGGVLARSLSWMAGVSRRW